MVTLSTSLAASPEVEAPRPAEDELAFQWLKVSLHEILVESLNLSMTEEVEGQSFRDDVRTLSTELCKLKASELSESARERMVGDLVDEVFGLGPLERLFNDPDVTDILVNHPHEVYVEKHGRLEASDVLFADNQHLTRIIQRLTARVGRRIDEVSSMVDARLPDGSRINAVVPPLAIHGPVLSIRRFSAQPLKLADLIESGSISKSMADFLIAAVDSRMSFLISGGTGAGKTTLLNALSEFIPREERLVTIEDSAELRLQHPHVVALETRTANTEGVGAVSQRELVRNSLRMRPDRILVGEVRSGEAIDMLQAMNSGHEGSLSTIHANDTREALARLEMMVAMSGFDLPVTVVRQYISAGIRLIVHVTRLKGGARKVVQISEIVGVENGEFQVRDIFGFRQTGLDDAGVAQGGFYASGYQPQCMSRLESAGVFVPMSLFDRTANAPEESL
jgi:pilus assembly protein CpaF